MGRLTDQPLRILSEVQHSLSAKFLTAAPSWYPAVSNFPPTEVLTRPFVNKYAQQLNAQLCRAQAGMRLRRSTAALFKSRKYLQPPNIVYPEDSLRRQFYSDHPWELARPRVVVESDGINSTRCDWSRGVVQLGQPTNGESVVQRWLYLMTQENVPRNLAYDIARKEFYAVRHAEDVARIVALEEALYYGAHFPTDIPQVSDKLESKAFREWRLWAESDSQNQNRAIQSQITSVDAE